MGQVGARAKKRKRAFMERLKGRFQKAKALRAAYHCGKVRKRKANLFLGSTPSLPRLLAMHGTHQTTMLPMEDASPAELDSVENKVERLLAPCCNAVTPYAGPQRVDWLLSGTFHLDTIGSLKQLVSEIMNCTALHKKYTVPQFHTVLLECKRPLKSTLFRKLFLKAQGHLLSRYSIYIPDRIPVRITIPDRNLLLALKAEFARLLSSSRLPSPLTAWLVDCITVTPQKSRKVHQCLRGARIHKTTKEMAMKLQSEKGTLVRLRGLNVGTLFHQEATTATQPAAGKPSLTDTELFLC